jgi:hypothetical protein
VTDKEVLALSKLPALTTLEISGCYNFTSEGLCAVSSLPALTDLKLTNCSNVKNLGQREVIK